MIFEAIPHRDTDNDIVFIVPETPESNKPKPLSAMFLGTELYTMPYPVVRLSISFIGLADGDLQTQTFFDVGNGRDYLTLKKLVQQVQFRVAINESDGDRITRHFAPEDRSSLDDLVKEAKLLRKSVPRQRGSYVQAREVLREQLSKAV